MSIDLQSETDTSGAERKDGSWKQMFEFFENQPTKNTVAEEHQSGALTWAESKATRYVSLYVADRYLQNIITNNFSIQNSLVKR